MSNSSTASSDWKTSKIKPASRDAPLEPALELLRQGNKFARDGQFSDAESVFRAADSLPGGKTIWNYKSLGFCPSLFPDASSMDAYTKSGKSGKWQMPQN